MAKQIVIGDIHGALRALKEVLAKAALEKNDTLIFLGDYVDGWSESAQLIEYLLELDDQYHCIFLKGNHDAWCEDWLIHGTTPRDWLISGGYSTIQSYEQLATERRTIHLEFYSRMKKFFEAEERLFIHAGYSSIHGPARDRYESNYYWDRSLWELAFATDDRLSRDSIRFPKRLKLYSEIFIGHTPTINFGSMLPMHATNVWNVDTGAAFTGRLTAMNVETKEYWQSEIVQKLYPGENGRNS